MGTLRELHPNPRFTKFLVEKKVFENDPLVVVDVGAKAGFEKHWDHYGDQIKLIGFEPNKDSFEECVRRKSNKQTKYYPYALDRYKGERDFFITAYPSSCGLYKPNQKMVEKFGAEDNLTVIEKIKVKTIDLDSFADQYEIDCVDFMKLDTEGSELDILHGAENVLNKSVLGLSIEVSFIKMHEGQPLISDIDQYLRRLGFKLYDLDLNRITRKALAPYVGIHLGVGQLEFAQALYLRDAADELDNNNGCSGFWNTERIIKMASILELYNLPDCAIELIQKSSSLGLIDAYEPNKLTNLLVPQINGQTISYEDYIHKLRLEYPKVNRLKKKKYRRIINVLPWPLNSLIIKTLLKIRDFVNLFL